VADRVLILGASARAAAASARRAGLDPFAIDLFADADTRQLCDCLRCPPDRYPEGLFELAKQAPPMPWMYTGGLENYPELIGELARERELWGNGPDVLVQVRDPHHLARRFTDLGLTFPRTVRSGEPTPRWTLLRKPLRSSGGGGIRLVTPDEVADASLLSDTHYFQAFVDGTPMSAVLEGGELLGYSRQLIGTAWLHARAFQYCGNVQTAPHPRKQWYALEHLSVVLCQTFNLYGVWGFDYIETPSGPVLVEINPRYMASVEVKELQSGCPAMLGKNAKHLRDGFDCFAPGITGYIVGKAIYYAPRRITFPASGPWDDSVRLAAEVWRRPDFADVPHPGVGIEAGHPVLTILTEADTESECLSRLQSRAAELDRLFGFPTPEGESCRP
jgi:predicted ATP-grasp superfamily ATP-dependent carboligase